MRISFLALAMCFLIVVHIHAGGDITKGMIGYWPLDGNAKDVSGNNYHGELEGKVTWKAAGKVGGAANFDGAGSHIKVAQKELNPVVLERVFSRTAIIGDFLEVRECGVEVFVISS